MAARLSLSCAVAMMWPRDAAGIPYGLTAADCKLGHVLFKEIVVATTDVGQVLPAEAGSGLLCKRLPVATFAKRCAASAQHVGTVRNDLMHSFA